MVLVARVQLHHLEAMARGQVLHVLGVHCEHMLPAFDKPVAEIAQKTQQAESMGRGYYDKRVVTAKRPDSIEHSPRIGQVLDDVAGDDDVEFRLQPKFFEMLCITEEDVVEDVIGFKVLNRFPAVIDTSRLGARAKRVMQRLSCQLHTVRGFLVSKSNASDMKNPAAFT